MTVDETKAADRFQLSKNFFQRGMLDLDFAATLTTDQVMVILLGNLVDQMPATRVSGTNQSVFSQELECAVDRWFGQAGDLVTGKFVYFGR